jgi:hypothetical protein
MFLLECHMGLLIFKSLSERKLAFPMKFLNGVQLDSMNIKEPLDA